MGVSPSLLSYPHVKNAENPAPPWSHPWKGEGQGAGGWGPGGGSSTREAHLPTPRQCCIDLEHGVLRLKAPFPELPFLPLHQEPGQ